MLTVRLDSDLPLAEQITRGLRYAIAAALVGPGDELPPVRQLADDLGVHLNTVARAYRALEATGLVSATRGRGTRVTSARESRAESAQAAKVRIAEGVRTALADAKLAGLDRRQAEALLSAALDVLWPGKED